MQTVNDLKVNILAHTYAKTGENDSFTDLYHEVEGCIRLLANNANRRAISKGVYIPIDDFESLFMQGLFQAVKGYDMGLGNFMPRLQTYLKRREADAWRKYETIGSADDKDGKRYDKARGESLEREIGNDGGSYTLGEAVLKPSRSAEAEFFENEVIEKTFAEFGETHERHSRVIRLLYLGLTNEELAKQLGEAEYNSKIRKLVQRAKEKFSIYLSKNQSA